MASNPVPHAEAPWKRSKGVWCGLSKGRGDVDVAPFLRSLAACLHERGWSVKYEIQVKSMKSSISAMPCILAFSVCGYIGTDTETAQLPYEYCEQCVHSLLIWGGFFLITQFRLQLVLLAVPALLQENIFGRTFLIYLITQDCPILDVWNDVSRANLKDTIKTVLKPQADCVIWRVCYRLYQHEQPNLLVWDGTQIPGVHCIYFLVLRLALGTKKNPCSCLSSVKVPVSARFTWLALIIWANASLLCWSRLHLSDILLLAFCYKILPEREQGLHIWNLKKKKKFKKRVKSIVTQAHFLGLQV